jgi:hypothetical protein
MGDSKKKIILWERIELDHTGMRLVIPVSRHRATRGGHVYHCTIVGMHGQHGSRIDLVIIAGRC